MTLSYGSLASRIARKPDDDTTTGPRIQVSRYDVGSAQCKTSAGDKPWSGSTDGSTYHSRETAEKPQLVIVTGP